MQLLEFTRVNLMECQKKVLKTYNNFASTFVDHHSLPDINCNGHSVLKKKHFHS